MSATGIEWATDVWNPFTGCDRVSPGCANCYAAEQAARNQRWERGRAAKARRQGKPDPVLRYQNDGDPKSSGPGFAFTVHWDRLERPKTWKPGARVFVNSMSDVFHEDAPIEAIGAMWEVFQAQPEVNFLILTKRPASMQRSIRWLGEHPDAPPLPSWSDDGLPNVWLGVSIENRHFVSRADALRNTPAAVRFISAEPLLGPLVDDHAPGLDLTDIDWLIVGGESGSDRRRYEERWAWQLLDASRATWRCNECRHDVPREDLPNLKSTSEGDRLGLRCPECDAAHTLRATAFFYKQGSAFRPGQNRELGGRTWDELPERPDGGAVRTAKELDQLREAA